MKERKILDVMTSIVIDDSYEGDRCPNCGHRTSVMYSYCDEPDVDYYHCNQCNLDWEDVE